MPPTLEDLSGPDGPAALARLRARAPVAWVEAINGWLVNGYDLAGAVMRDATTFTVDDPRFSTAQVVGASMLSLDGAEQRRHRQPFAAAFRPARLEQTFAAPVRTLAVQLLDRVRSDGHAELRTSLAGPLSVGVMTDALGLRGADAVTVLGWYTAIVGAVSALSAGGEAGPVANRAMTALAEHIRSGLERGSILVAAGATLAEPEVIANAAVMMFGGIETTEGMILNALLHLLHHPGALAEVRLDHTLLPAAVEESLRLEPAAAAVDRYATRDVVLAGSTIRRGDLVRVSITAANRDPAVFTEPDRFDLHRVNVREQLAFARGPHVCIAMDLARLETTAALEAVLSLPGLRLFDAAPVTGLIFRKPASLVVGWDVDQT